MFFKVRMSLVGRFVLILALLGGLFGAMPTQATGAQQATNSLEYVSLSLPAGTTDAEMYDISGSTDDQLYAVGAVRATNLGYIPLLYRNDGTGWVEDSPIVVDGSAKLYGVWGFNSGILYAVGEGNNLAGKPLLYQYDGTNWSNVSLPGSWFNPVLIDVWGSSPDNMYAAGWAVGPVGHVPILYRKDSTGWLEQHPALPAGWSSGYLRGVWGSAADNVYAVGWGRISDRVSPLLYKNDGTAWAANGLDLPLEWSSGYLNSVWGSAADDVYAVGYGNDATGRSMPLIYHYNGIGWSQATLSLPAGVDYVYLYGVGGTGAGNVYAVGYGADTAGSVTPLLYHNDGTGWTETVVSRPPGWESGYLLSVWASSSGDIYAVGDGSDMNGMKQPLLYQGQLACSLNSITVTNTNDSGPSSLRQAIVNICPGGTIDFDLSLAGETINLDSALAIDKDLIIDGTSLSANIKLDGASRLQTLVGIHSGTLVTIRNLDFLNAQHGISSSGILHLADSLFTGNGTGIQTATRLTVKSTNFFENTRGIANFGILQVEDSAFTANDQGLYNEKIYDYPADATIINSVFNQNDQGGIQNQNGILNISNGIFKDNRSDYGGAIKTIGIATISSSQFINNIASQNGGGLNNGGFLTIRASTFSGNAASNNGGAIFNTGGVELIESTFVNNHAGNFGGGLFVAQELLLTNSTLANNSAVQGGGIYYEPFSALIGSTFTNNTFAGNSGGGLYITKGTLHLSNNLMADSPTGSDCYKVNTATVTGSSNLIEANGNFPNTCNVAVITEDPRLGHLSNNGGPSQTMALLPGSPAIDAGNDTDCPAMDQRGVFRPQGSHCDIGAYEADASSSTSYVNRMVDFDGDGRAEIAVFRPSSGTWYIRGQGNFVYGKSGDVPTPGDYNGDGQAEAAVFRPSEGTWYIRGQGSFVYGTTGDIPVAADYNGDGKDDIAVFRPSNSAWYIRGVGPVVYGAAGDIPVIGDYNGDGKDDIAVFRPSNSTWYIRGVGPIVYGAASDIPVIGDYNGDGKDDIAVFRPSNSTWYIRGIGPMVHGTAGDLPVVGDYNGDGSDDVAVFRPSTSTWYIRGVGPFLYGTAGDIPV